MALAFLPPGPFMPASNAAVLQRAPDHGRCGLAILRFHGLFLGPLRRLPFFRSHRRLLLAFFIRAAIFAHAVRSLSVLLHIHYTAEWRKRERSLRVVSRPFARISCYQPLMSSFSHKRTFQSHITMRVIGACSNAHHV